jgi:hypothetical protein
VRGVRSGETVTLSVIARGAKAPRNVKVTME